MLLARRGWLGEATGLDGVHWFEARAHHRTSRCSDKDRQKIWLWVDPRICFSTLLNNLIKITGCIVTQKKKREREREK